MSRSRTCWSPDLRYSCQRVVVSSAAATCKRIRRGEAESSGPRTRERAPREVAHPDREHSSGQRDHPRASALEGREHRNQPQTRGEHREEEPEQAPLHARILPSTALIAAREKCDDAAGLALPLWPCPNVLRNGRSYS